MRARLVDDGGEAASSPTDFFRSPEFLAAESATHSLLIDAGGVGVAAALPLLVREIPGAEDEHDAISPYGYPGGALAGDPLDPALVDWSETGLVSVFVREAAGRPVFSTAGERGALQIADPGLKSGVRPRLREQIRATERSGYALESIEGAGSSPGQRAAFEHIYTETMRRTGASGRYFFDSAYFEAALASTTTTLLLCHAPDGEPAAGAIAAESDGVLHYFLGGTADAHLEASPMKSLFAAMIGLAKELKMPLSLGGGLSPGDGLERFKRGFANTTLPFQTTELVLDAPAYQRLSSAPTTPSSGAPDVSSAPSFFPAYRAHSA
ncbi:MAG: GNAT family N-acetyltransferase [Solirubrobacterales bacterium]